MESNDPPASEEIPAPDARDKPGTEAYEPPRITEFGSLVELTVGGEGQPTDTGSTSFTL